MNIFFTFRNKETACGMWSTTYIIALVVDILLIAISLYVFRKASKNTVRKILLIMGIWTTATEVVKQIFMVYQDGVGDVEFLPLYFCSLFMFCSFMATSKNITVRTAGSSFLFFGGIIGATAFFIYPNACIPNYPIYHFMCIRTMLFHGSMIFSGLLIVISGYYTPSIKHFKHYLITMSIICALAYLFNTLLGWDLMYMSNPLGFAISQNIYDFAPKLYPFIFMILEIFVPFFISYFAYFLIMKIIGRKRSLNMLIETERLVITEFTMDMAKVVQENSVDENNKKYLPDEVWESVEEVEDTLKFLISKYGSCSGPLVYPIIVKETNDNVGYVQLVPLGENKWEIGYHVAKRFTGKGYATEAVKAFLPVIAKKVNVTEIYGVCLAENKASLSVMEKCGFKNIFKGFGLYQGANREIVKGVWNLEND